MSIEAISWVIKQDIPDGVAKLVAMVLADYADRHTGEAHPKIRQLAQACSQSERSVQRKLRVLQDLDVLTIQLGHCPKSGRQRANSYILHLPGVERPERLEPLPRGDQPGAGSVDDGPRGDSGAPHAGGEGCPSVTREGDKAVTGEGDSPVTPIGNPSDSTVRRDSPQPPVAGGQAQAANPVFGQDRAADRAGDAPRSRPGRRGAPPPSLSTEAEARYRQLTAAYPADGVRSARLTDAQAAFADLTPAEQAHAVREAAAYAELCRRREQRPKALQTWLRHGFDRAGARPDGTPAPVQDLAAIRNAEGMRQAERGSWPTGCSILVLADSAEGAAWEAYFLPLGVKPRWMQLSAGLGAYLPSKSPPVPGVA
ncbi:helix-turn-helix domain-containing protein [Methylobacterium gossipiicola]|uniref:Helix-turn-helix domain-containing protein n=1 Tax=Methylobacterium gossipiicola TaxID=582675 RepID=A0A1I2VTL9_9HYPH|nr:helix-turn-helix domain-containing protein [Methylobacterium gossipiicola]SFG92645.1 Helix-turn-helix domain-containing protein [Methylobacterium gossipiicola]